MLDIKVDASQLIKACEEAAKFSDKTKTEIVNQALYFVAKGALYNTYAPEKDKITSALNKSADVNAKASIANILVNVKRKAAGKKGLNGQKMAIATQKLINAEVSHRNFARSGWVGAIKTLAPHVKRKGGAAKTPPGVRLKIANSGGAIPATTKRGKVTGKIFNSINGKHNSEAVEKYQREGLQKAVDAETRDKLEYAAKKEMEQGLISIFK
jgi:hypothetical protein